MSKRTTKEIITELFEIIEYNEACYYYHDDEETTHINGEPTCEMTGSEALENIVSAMLWAKKELEAE